MVSSGYHKAIPARRPDSPRVYMYRCVGVLPRSSKRLNSCCSRLEATAVLQYGHVYFKYRAHTRFLVYRSWPSDIYVCIAMTVLVPALTQAVPDQTKDIDRRSPLSAHVSRRRQLATIAQVAQTSALYIRKRGRKYSSATRKVCISASPGHPILFQRYIFSRAT